MEAKRYEQPYHEKADKNYEEGEIVREGVVRAIQKVGNNLEVLTINLDNNLPHIKASKMPEYTEAKNAIERYQLAVQNKMDLLNKGYKTN